MYGIEKDYDRDTANEMLNQSGFGICDKATCFYALCFQKNKHIKLAGSEKLRIERALPEAKDRAQMVRDVLRNLGQPKLEALANI